MNSSIRQLDYQDRVLTAIDAYLDQLKEKKVRADKIADLAAQDPDLDLPIPDFPAGAWEELKAQDWLPPSRAGIPYSPRRDGCERPVPNIVLKVPTGGGKTWLAISGISKVMGRYLDSNRGFVLWIVPNEAIYTQTLKHLKDRQHPYRQSLDRAAAGRVRIMEKNDRLDARDIEEHLCVMLLMLQSAGRQNKETLKIFRDRGDVHGFFPPEGEQQAHKAILEKTPNLDAYNDLYPMVKDSLGNALRTIRPIVVLDEGHKAISQLAHDTLYGFNPCFVLELTATPKDVKERSGKNPRPARYANVLVEVSGAELDREEMIKMPLNLDPKQGNDWRTTMNAALATLKKIDRAAKKLRADTNRYIRPIMLIQVERTGIDQRESGHIHAEDVKAMLLTAGVDEAEIAIKTAEQNDLNQPENQNLLSPTNRVRFIITKQALQEGWDCPFAYILCALAASSNLSSMTQLVGRILRQPGAIKTEVDALDECHVITHHAQTASVVEAIKQGLERDGLGDLVIHVPPGQGQGSDGTSRSIKRRDKFSKMKIYLPKVLIVDGADVRKLDYDTDVLSRIDWRDFNPKDIAASIPKEPQAAESQLQKIRIAKKGKETFVNETVARNSETLTFDKAYAVRMILDIVPNPFVGWDIVERMETALRKRGFNNKKLGQAAGLIVEELRKGLDEERSKRAEELFKKEAEAGRIQFRLRQDGRNWQMPFKIGTTEPEDARQLPSKTGGPLEKSLFALVYENELNKDERQVAVYLDGHEALTWWHRNAARSQYGLQGWKRHKIYPDFIFALQHDGKTKRTILLETKGDHLDNLDTDYKKEALAFLGDIFQLDDAHETGGIKDIGRGRSWDGDTVEGALVRMGERDTELPKLIDPESTD